MEESVEFLMWVTRKCRFWDGEIEYRGIGYSTDSVEEMNDLYNEYEKNK